MLPGRDGENEEYSVESFCIPNLDDALLKSHCTGRVAHLSARHQA